MTKPKEEKMKDRDTLIGIYASWIENECYPEEARELAEAIIKETDKAIDKAVEKERENIVAQLEKTLDQAIETIKNDK